MLCIGIICVSIVAVEGLYNEPIIDFRPYAVGVDVKKAMEIPADAEQPEYDTEFILEKDGNQQIFTLITIHTRQYLGVCGYKNNGYKRGLSALHKRFYADR